MNARGRPLVAPTNLFFMVGKTCFMEGTHFLGGVIHVSSLVQTSQIACDLQRLREVLRTFVKTVRKPDRKNEKSAKIVLDFPQLLMYNVILG